MCSQPAAVQIVNAGMDAGAGISEDLQMELEALQATFDLALTVTGSSTAARTDAPGAAAAVAVAVSAHDAPPVLAVQLALAPLTGGDESSAYVLATLGLSVGAAYPDEPPACRLVASRGVSLLDVNSACFSRPAVILTACGPAQSERPI